MKIMAHLTLLFIFTTSIAFSQQSVYDSLDKHYAGIDFKFKDDLSFWTYRFQKKRATKKDASFVGGYKRSDCIVVLSHVLKSCKK